MSEVDREAVEHVVKALTHRVTLQMCLAADTVFEGMALTSAGRVWMLPAFQAISPRKWLKMYRSHRWLIATLESPFAPFEWSRQDGAPLHSRFVITSPGRRAAAGNTHSS